MLKTGAAVLLVFVCLQTGGRAAAVPPLELKISRETRLLVVAAHPDDETIAAGGLIRRVTAAGGEVRVIILTSGDAFYAGVKAVDPAPPITADDYRLYGERREQETRDALEILGVAPEHVTFLGFPDEGLCLLASKYLTARAYESPYTTRVTPPDDEQIVRGVRYRGIDLRRELDRLVTAFEPTIVAIPHPLDEHPDHCATHIFAREAVRADAARHPPGARVIHYLVHYGHWPSTTNTDVRNVLAPPRTFPPLEGRWTSLALTPAEAAAKRRALVAYHTQMAVIGPFLLAFGGSNELFLEGEPASLPECWCNGENVATELPPEKRRRRPTSHP